MRSVWACVPVLVVVQQPGRCESLQVLRERDEKIQDRSRPVGGCTLGYFYPGHRVFATGDVGNRFDATLRNEVFLSPVRIVTELLSKITIDTP